MSPRAGARRCALFDADLRRRGAAEKTRRAYGDRPRPVRALVRRASGVEPGRGRRRATLRRYAAALSDRARGRRRPSRASSPRCARFFRALREHGDDRAEPGRPDPGAQAPAQAAARAQARRGRRAARPHPGLDAARAARPRAVRARLRLRAARRGARQPRRRRRSTSTPRRCASRARARKTRIVPVGRAGAARASRATSSAAGPALGDRRRRAGAVPLEVRAAAVDVRRPPPPAGLGAPRRGAGRRLTRTRCATRSRPTCSTAAPTCGRSRSCSGTHPSPRRRSTLG